VNGACETHNTAPIQKTTKACEPGRLISFV
jgi:hypothetical protein